MLENIKLTTTPIIRYNDNPPLSSPVESSFSSLTSPITPTDIEAFHYDGMPLPGEMYDEMPCFYKPSTSPIDHTFPDLPLNQKSSVNDDISEFQNQRIKLVKKPRNAKSSKRPKSGALKKPSENTEKINNLSELAQESYEHIDNIIRILRNIEGNSDFIKTYQNISSPNSSGNENSIKSLFSSSHIINSRPGTVFSNSLKNDRPHENLVDKIQITINSFESMKEKFNENITTINLKSDKSYLEAFYSSLTKNITFIKSLTKEIKTVNDKQKPKKTFHSNKKKIWAITILLSGLSALITHFFGINLINSSQMISNYINFFLVSLPAIIQGFFEYNEINREQEKENLEDFFETGKILEDKLSALDSSMSRLRQSIFDCIGNMTSAKKLENLIQNGNYICLITLNKDISYENLKNQIAEYMPSISAEGNHRTVAFYDERLAA